jgi:signal transduction histidine kinase
MRSAQSGAALVDGDRRVHFILDPTPMGDADGDGVDDKSHVFDRYDEATPALLEALHTGRPTAETSPSRDAWGTFISGYAPFHDSTGRLAGIVGVDLTAEEYVKRLAGMHHAARFAAFIALIVSLATGCAVFLMRRYAAAVRAEQRRAEEEHRRYTRSVEEAHDRVREQAATLAARSAELQEAQMRAEAASRAKSEFLANISHEEIEAGKLELSPVSFALRDSLADTIKPLALRAHQKQLELACEVPADVPDILIGDPGRLRQIIVNLVGNAIKFTEQGEVVVGVKRAL